MLCHSVEVRGNSEAIIDILVCQFGARETVQDLQRLFFEWVQTEYESLMDFSRSLIRGYDSIIKAAGDQEKNALKALKDKSLIRQFVSGARKSTIRLELRRQELSNPEQTFVQMRAAMFDLFEEPENLQPKFQVRSIETDVVSAGKTNHSLHHLIEQQQVVLSKMVHQQHHQSVLLQQLMQAVQNLAAVNLP